MLLPKFLDIEQAAKRLQGNSIQTPMLSHKLLDKVSGLKVYLKDETKQHTHSFKYRGAFARMSLLNEKELKRGVVAFSSGNHAQAVALVARQLGTNAVIVMPKTAPDIKKKNTLALGAKIVEYDIATQSREKIAANIAKQEGRTLIPAFDDKYIIAGQGSCGLEIMQQCQKLGFTPDAVIAPIGGGGLAVGIGLAVKSLSLNTKMFAAEPFEFDDQYRSLQTGKRQRIKAGGTTICDALMSPMPGRLTFALNKKQCDAIYRVSDDEIKLTMRLLYETLGVKVEPAGAIALAASMNINLPKNSKICVMLSGGNIDNKMFANMVGLS